MRQSIYKLYRRIRRMIFQPDVVNHRGRGVIPLYKDILLLPDVEAYLHNFGFEMVKRFPAHGSFDSQHDCVFLKQNARGKIADLIRQVYSF